jgi:hypothetical protein
VDMVVVVAVVAAVVVVMVYSEIILPLQIYG